MRNLETEISNNNIDYLVKMGRGRERDHWGISQLLEKK
jgi:hypothetical protein